MTLQEIWNAAIQLAQDHLENCHSMLPPNLIHTTTEERCWVTLMVLQKEEEL
jgi:hypothetical protein